MHTTVIKMLGLIDVPMAAQIKTNFKQKYSCESIFFEVIILYRYHTMYLYFI